MDRFIGIGDYIISNCEEDILKTFALASCVAITAYSRDKRVAGMIHMALPNAKDAVIVKKGYYVSSGIPALLYKMEMDYHCNLHELVL